MGKALSVEKLRHYVTQTFVAEGLADIQAGIGPFLGVYLLAHSWQSGHQRCKGLHVMTPLIAGELGWSEAETFAQAICAATATDNRHRQAQRTSN